MFNPSMLRRLEAELVRASEGGDWLNPDFALAVVRDFIASESARSNHGGWWTVLAWVAHCNTTHVACYRQRKELASLNKKLARLERSQRESLTVRALMLKHALTDVLKPKW